MTMFANPSRADAWALTRHEKMSMMFLMNTVSALIDSKEDLADRLKRIDGGTERMATLADTSMGLLDDLRTTIPTNQRVNLNNTAKDYEMRLVPKMTPNKTNVVVQKEEFRKLVNAAQVKCRECTLNDEECKQCELYQLLTVILPMEKYNALNLCPYMIADWEN